MSNLKLLRTRIKSIKSTQKITKAMQLVSATKFTRAKNQVKNSEDYVNIFHTIMANLAFANNLQDMKEKEKKFFLEDLDIVNSMGFSTKSNAAKALNNREATRDDLNKSPSINYKTHLLIVITSKRGLCGALNFLLIHQIKSDIAKLKELNKKVKLIIIGKKGYNALKGEYINYIDSFYDFPKPNDNNLSAIIREKIIKLFENSEISHCQIYFNKCKNAIVQIPIKQQILPVKQQTTLEQDKYLSYKYEGKDLIFNMINLYINSQINYALLHSRASEEGARMTAMDNATNNANDIIDKLSLKLNKSRQNLITKDLIEIITGAEAL